MKIIAFCLLLLLTFPLIAQQTIQDTDSLVTLAESYVKDKKYQESKALFAKVADQYKISENIGMYFYCLNKKAESLIELSAFKEASQTVERVLTLNQQQKESFLLAEATAYMIKERLARINNDLQSAKTFAYKALAIRQQVSKNDLNLGHIYQSLGIIFSQTNLDSAIICYQQAHNYFKLNATTQNESARMLCTIGSIYDYKGQHDKAIQFLQHGIRTYLNASPVDSLNVARAYHHLSWASIEKGNIAAGINYSQKGLLLLQDYKPSKSGTVSSILYVSLSNAYQVKKEYKKSLGAMKKGYEIAQKIADVDPTILATYYSNLGNLYHKTGHLNKAIQFLEKYVRTIADKQYAVPFIKYKHQAQTLNSLGDVYFTKKDYPEAIKYFKQCIFFFQKTKLDYNPTLAMLYNDLAKGYLHNHDIQAALNTLTLALDANCGADYSSPGLYSMLNECLNQSILLTSIHLKAMIDVKQYQATKDIKFLVQASKMYDNCDTLINNTFSVYEEEDQLTFASETHEIFKNAIETNFKLYHSLSEPKYLEKAFYFSERSKSNTLLKGLAGTNAFRFANLPDSILLEINQFQKDISTAQKALQNIAQTKDSINILSQQLTLSEIKKEYQQKIEFLEKNYLEYYRLKYDYRITTIPEIQSAISSTETGVVEYFLADSSIYIFTITAHDFQGIHLPLENHWKDQMVAFRKSLTDIDVAMSDPKTAYAHFAKNSHHLFLQLLQPVISQFSHIKRLKVIPDGVLGYIPFEVLLKKMPTQKQIDHPFSLQAYYLIQDYAISYAYSATIMMKDQRHSNLQVQYNYGGFAPEYDLNASSLLDSLITMQATRSAIVPVDLPAARKAVTHISEMVKGTAFLSAFASEKNFKEKAPEYKILHLAMHGIINDENPLYSKLLFSLYSDSLEDNSLNAYELYNMQLPAQLAVLSACNTGMGAIQKGEGIMSLSRAFAYAGVQSIIMSLWSVPDDETGQLMTHFFQELKEGKTKDQALRYAKLKYLNNSNVLPERLHPVFWSGFIQIGDSRTIELHKIDFPWKWIVLGLICIFLGGIIWNQFYHKTIVQ